MENTNQMILKNKKIDLRDLNCFNTTQFYHDISMLLNNFADKQQTNFCPNCLLKNESSLSQKVLFPRVTNYTSPVCNRTKVRTF